MKRLYILEGISGAGKSTILAELNKARNFQDYHWHRFTATEWVYGALENRPVLLPTLREYEAKISAIWPTTLVTLTCDPYVALQRKENMPNEIIEPNLATANKLFVIYHNHLTAFQSKVLINTSQCSIERTVELILRVSENENNSKNAERLRCRLL